LKTRPTDPATLRAQEHARIKRQALRQLKRTKLVAAKTGVDLSEWEGEFLGSVEERIQTYGRAFADPEKGGGGAAFSVLQTVKLKEIAAKAKGEKRGFGRAGRKGFKVKGDTED
jgi:hypothetical protein